MAGPDEVTLLKSVPNVPPLVTTTAAPLPPPPPIATTDRRDITPDQEILYPGIQDEIFDEPGVVSWQDFLRTKGFLPDDWNQYPMPGQHPDYGAAVVIQDVPVIVESEETEMGILGDIYTGADILAGGLLPNIGGYGVDPGFGVNPVTGFSGPVNLPAVQSGGGMVPPTGVPVVVCPTDDPYKGMIYTIKRGWHKRPRRRRRDLATKGDIKDLGALKGVLGTGKAFELWIATHS